MRVSEGCGLGVLALAAGVSVQPGAADASVIAIYSPGATTLSFNGSLVFNVPQGSITGASSSDVVQSTSLNTIGGGTQNAPVKLSAGTSVGPTAFSDPQQNGSISGAKGQQFYVGLDALSPAPGGGTQGNFGYVEYSMTNAVLGYAFETAPNTAIVTADLTPALTGVPEPASLGLLAAGVAGVAAIRRRRAHG